MRACGDGRGLPPREYRLNDTDPRRSDPPSAARARGQAMEFRPTLFGEEDPAGTGADGLRILGSLQPLPPPRLHRHRGRWVLGGLLAATLAASAWLAMRYAVLAPAAAGSLSAPVDTDLATRHPSSAGSTLPPPAAPASVVMPAPAASAGAVDAAPAAARIETDVPPAAAVATRDPFAGLAQPQGSSAPVAAVQPTRVARAEPRRQPAAQPVPPAAPSTTPQATRRSGDEDVELIEAVVSHGAGRKRAPQPASHASASARGHARDVVQRQATADSTAELLQRCEAVGGLEGMLCRWRICADRWGQDPACPKNTQRPYREPS